MAKRIIPIVVLLALLGAAIYYLVMMTSRNADANDYSGTVEAVEVAVAPETPGRILDVLVEEGAAVKAGEALLKMDDSLLTAQRKRAQAGLDAAGAALSAAKAAAETAKAGLEVARTQALIVTDAARAADLKNREDSWTKDLPPEIEQPAWYFQKVEELDAAAKEVSAAEKALEEEQAAFDKLIKSLDDQRLRDAEERLAEAQVAFLAAKDVLDRASTQGAAEPRDAAQSAYDTAQAELDASQTDFDHLLTQKDSDDLREERARLAVARERYLMALDRQRVLLSGDEALQVRAAAESVTQAEAGVAQAEAGVAQAEKGLAQAQAELDLLDVQIDHLTIVAPLAGVITTRSVEPGEVVQAGTVALKLAQMDKLSITVYVPEDRYGAISLGQQAQVSLDSFPGDVFMGRVERIADKAEFTPRNVQTKSGRRTTVFAIKLAVENTDGKLKPGMPADVKFQ